jgi:hypothetical protein
MALADSLAEGKGMAVGQGAMAVGRETSAETETGAEASVSASTPGVMAADGSATTPDLMRRRAHTAKGVPGVMPAT